MPILIAYFLSSDVLPQLKPYAHLATGVLIATTTLQALLVLWSLIAHWDAELAYDEHATSQHYELREAWALLGKGQAKDLAVEYDLLMSRQSAADAKDTLKGITPKEQQLGMRAGLIHFQRTCVCKERPKSRSIPWYVSKKCMICGGN